MFYINKSLSDTLRPFLNWVILKTLHFQTMHSCKKCLLKIHQKVKWLADLYEIAIVSNFLRQFNIQVSAIVKCGYFKVYPIVPWLDFHWTLLARKCWISNVCIIIIGIAEIRTMEGHGEILARTRTKRYPW